MEHILELQKTAISELQAAIRNYGKDPKIRKTKPDYYINKIQKLEQWWITFEARHNSLKEAPDNEQPYFKENLFQSTKNMYLKHRTELQESLMAVTSNGHSSKTTNIDSSEDEKETDAFNNLLESTLKEMEGENGSSDIGTESEILKLLYQDICDQIRYVNLMTDKEKSGYVKAQADALKESWNAFRAKFFELRSTKNKLSLKIEIKTVQRSYTYAAGKLNEMLTESKSQDNVQLPKIKIPEFSGKATDWRTYIELFNKIIHANNSISDSIKMQYLKTSLKGEAAKLVAHIAPTEENYFMCYNILQKRYDNKRRLFSKLMDNIINLQKHSNENSEDLQRLHDVTNESMMAIKNLGFDTDNWDPVVSHILIKKLHEDTIKHYECQLEDIREPQTLQEFLTYIESRFLAIQSAESKSVETKSAESKSVGKQFQSFNNKKEKFERTIKCSYCSEEHYIMKCQKFLAKEVNERNQWTKSKKLCINCFGNHKYSECKSKFTCKNCNKKHNTLLHFESVKANVAKISNDINNTINTVDETNVVSANAANIPQYDSRVILATAIVSVEAKNGEKIALRALLDQGSQSSFISEGAMQLLQLTKITKRYEVNGIFQTSEISNYVVDLQIKPRFSSTFVLPTRAIILRRLTNLSESKLNFNNNFDHIQHLQLADPAYREPGLIDIILGASEYAQILKSGLIKGLPNEPIAQDTELGWIVSGPTSSNLNTKSVTVLISTIEINDKINEFFKNEDILDTQTASITEEEQMCEEHFNANVQRLANGQYQVKIPFKNGTDTPILAESRKYAVATLHQLEKRFRTNPSLNHEYKKFIDEYLALDHMELSPRNSDSMSYYMPHHCIMRDSTTTKLRVVFNASQKTMQGNSLNEEMALGKLEQTDISSILIKFRFYQYAFTADIEKMYRQILIDESQRNLQKILWRDSPELPIQEYRLKTITYGTANAPYLAIRTLKQLAIDCQSEFPDISNLILNNMYVDDLLAGGFSKDEIINTYKNLKRVFNSAKFNLRKWCTNNKDLLNVIPSEDREQKAICENVKALGISWCSFNDNFTYELKISHHIKPFTKRLLLSEISSLFDPLGWICPVVISAKCLMQQLWKCNTDWDEVVPLQISEKWLKIKNELNLINELQIPRWINYHPNDVMELHGFGDASEVAFAAVIYIKNVTKNTVQLLVAKNRVAPLKHSKDALTIPRLELCAANLLAKLSKKVLQSVNIKFSNIFLWSDSKIVIDWLHGNPKKYKTYIANRLCAIDKLVGKTNWYHVSTENNPADCASRGILPSQLKIHSQWWTGPKFLYEQNYLISNEFTDIEPSIKLLALTAIVDKNSHILPDVSTFSKLKRIIAYCLRFIKICLTKIKCTDPISADEMTHAETAILKIVQGQEFTEDIHELSFKKSVIKSSNILKLSPFLDQSGVLRVGGRLRKSDLSFNAKHPALLPKNNPVTTLIIRANHQNCLHGGPKCTEAVVRQKYWIINSISEIKKILSKCVTCFRQKKSTMSQLMADLPANRVDIVQKPFTNVAVDFTGAINYKYSKGRGGKIGKAYICIFVCMSTKALHVELVSDLTAEAFIASFRRLIARRGMVTNMYSDNGTNFVRANKNLKDLNAKEIEEFENSICDELTSKGTNWHFSPAGAPHFNGLAEAAVKTVKTHLIKTIGQTTLTFEELATLLYQIEACANSRPLCALSTDPDDIELLTPGHFLIGTSLLAPPDESLIETNVNWLSRWQLIQRMSQTVWKKFRNEYLNQLQTKSKWFTKQEEPKVNDVVVVKEENSPPCQWPLAKIVEVHKGEDNLTRVVSLKMRDKIVKRPVAKLSPLPIESNSQNLEKIHSHFTRTRKQNRNFAFNILPIVTAFLAIFATTVSTMPNISPCTVEKFDTSPGMYFEQVTSARFSYTNWNAIVYINLKNFRNDFITLTGNFSEAKNICYTKLNEYGPCKALSQLIENRFNDIDEKNELIFSFKQHRSKRATLDIIGNIASDLFGILDSRFAKSYVMDIQKLATNDQHLLQLLRNHTSIIDSTVNIIKHDENELLLQSKNIQELTNEMKNTIDLRQASLYFQSLTSYVLHLLSDYERQQDALLNVMINTHKNSVDPNLLTPAQMKRQLKVIAEQIDGDMSTPDETEFYKLVTVIPYISNQTLFFRVSIPLLNNEKFQIFHIHSVPFVKTDQAYKIKSHHDILITSINRQKYQLIQKSEMNNCKTLNSVTLICYAPRKWLTSQVSTCAWNLFNRLSDQACTLEPTPHEDVWIELDEPNKWLFFLFAETKLIAICDERVSHFVLKDAGTLALNPNCVMRTATTELNSQNELEHSTHEFVLPNFSLNSTAPVEINTQKLLKTNEFLKSNLSKLEAELDTVKHQSILPKEISNHDIHHYVMSYALLLSIGIFAYILHWLKQKVGSISLANTIPRSISMPNLPHGSSNMFGSCQNLPVGRMFSHH